MKRSIQAHSRKHFRAALAIAGIVVLSVTLAACGGESNSKPSPTGAVSTSTVPADSTAIPSQATGNSPVLPVSANLIVNTSTVQALTIDSVLVENNVEASGKDTSDHLEIALTNTGAAELTAFEIFYTFSDPATGTTESYYAKLPASFTIPAGESRVAHFDNTGAVDHFPVSDFSLYYTNRNAMDVTVTVSATDAAIQTATTKKDAGGAEEAD